MAEPLLRIIARFNIHEDPDFPLNGRAYLSANNLEAYKSDLVYAVKRLRQVVESPELSAARRKGFDHTIAIMWGEPQSDGKVDEMIDFLGWQYKTWEENGEISGWVTRNGVIVKSDDGIQQVTCEGGEDVLHAKKKCRRENSPVLFYAFGLKIPCTGLKPEHDFCSPGGRFALKKILQQEHHYLRTNNII